MEIEPNFCLLKKLNLKVLKFKEEDLNFSTNFKDLVSFILKPLYSLSVNPIVKFLNSISH